MPFSRYLPYVLIVLASIPCSAQQTQQNNTLGKAAPQDAQAVAVLNQALNAAGGSTAVSAVADYVAAGNITYYNEETTIQGSVTLEGLGLQELRIDAVVPGGTRSWTVVGGQMTLKMEDGTMTYAPPQGDAIPDSEVQRYPMAHFPSSFGMPCLQLSPAIGDPLYGISYHGVKQIDGHSVHDIQLQFLALSHRPNPYVTRDIFIDTSSLQLVATQDGDPNYPFHRAHYSNYQTVNGVPVPFSISETIGTEQQIVSIQLSKITFNTGLQDSAFVIQ